MMTRQLAFLRGVNIGGRNRLSMREVKSALEESGLADVSTLLGSGNIVFSGDGDARALIERTLEARLGVDVPVYTIVADALRDILSRAPGWWGTDDAATYDNLIFILSSDTPQEICRLLGAPSEGLERVMICDQVIFWTFDRAAYQRCCWWKRTAAPGIAGRLTIRTAGTVRKAVRRALEDE